MSDMFKLAVDNASDHIVITDAEGVIVYANLAVERITGYSPKEIVGKKAGSKDLWGGQMDKKFYEKLWKTIKIDKKRFSAEIKNRRKNGEIYIAETKIAPVLDENKNVLFFVSIERDITKEREIDRMKTEFVSLASHQLRTPLTSIKWLLEILVDEGKEKFSDEQKETIKSIDESNERMIELVNSLLNISRIESGKIVFEPQVVDILESVKEVVESVRTKLEAKKQKIKLKKRENEKFMVSVDPRLIENVFENLLANAIDYSPENGEIEVSLLRKNDDVLVEISDSGVGIPRDEQHRVFEKFYRGSNVSSGSVGTGLGLYLTKTIVDSSGGKIWFESSEGRGTKFWISLPLVEAR